MKLQSRVVSVAFRAAAIKTFGTLWIKFRCCQPAIKDGKAVAAEAAGGHLDPQNTGKHEGPEGQGHLGDLPVLVVNNDGIATEPVTAPRLKSLDEVKDKALMIHVGGDNMSDQPKPLGGGGTRYACGVIK